MIHLSINIKSSGYGKKTILSDINLELEKGKIHSFIGPNGAGKSTLLKSILGITDFCDGKIIFEDKDITSFQVEDKIRKGISFVPQGNRVFNDLSVYENLEIGGYLIKEKKLSNDRVEKVLEIFPSLKTKLKQDAGDLSGGEKQQLSLARAMMLEPSLLMLDEPSLGLAPSLVKSAFEIISDINKNFHTTILIVEQKVREVLKISDRAYGLRLGKIVFEGKAQEIANNNEMLKELFL